MRRNRNGFKILSKERPCSLSNYTKGALIHPYGRVRSAEGLIFAQGFSPALRLAAMPQTGEATLPLRQLTLSTP